MKHQFSLLLAVLLLLAATQCVAQSRIGTQVAGGDFNDLFDSAPTRKQVTVLATAYTPDQWEDKVNPTLEKCNQEVSDAFKRIRQIAHEKKPQTDTEKLAVVLAIKLVSAEHLLLLEAMMNDNHTASLR